MEKALQDRVEVARVAHIVQTRRSQGLSLAPPLPWPKPPEQPAEDIGVAQAERSEEYEAEGCRCPMHLTENSSASLAQTSRDGRSIDLGAVRA